jgi:putative restriction endonuclease
VVKDQNYWLQKLAKLRIDRARGAPAPHKPLLLFVIMEMMEKGEIESPEVTLSQDIAFGFSVFWSVVAPRRKQRPDVRLPFHDLSSSGIWAPLTAQGELSPDKKLTKVSVLGRAFLSASQMRGFVTRREEC